MKALTLEDIERLMARVSNKRNPAMLQAWGDAICRVDVYGSEYGWYRRDGRSIGSRDSDNARK